MSRCRLAVIALGVLFLFDARQVDAQDRWRVRVNIDAGAPVSSTAFDESITTAVHLEDAVANAEYRVTTGPQFDGGVTLRLAPNLGVGVGVSRFVKKNDAAIAGTIPHPFFSNTLRSIEGTARDLERNELAAHLQAVYLISVRRVDMALSSGPSFFSVKQDLMTDVSYSESYPYDTATFTTASFTTVARRAIGFNVGADIGVRLIRHVGVGALVRFSRASLVFAVPGSTATVKSDVGGLQALGGIRIFF
jgi:hypothetical protein